ncbi:proteasome subunit alpha type-5-like [Drosophila innubila]|uniref:proteasome subunit alpha type-5-like n=1 Tax=Drosophila innubila TaxID=198719 RepID=UPI00148BD55F|nr:proteasome subunit alpha type-5-like [Drosophila innubila]
MNLIRDKFSPDGRLLQLEHSLEAIQLGCTVIGICTNTCVVLAAEKRITSPLMVTKNVERIVKLDDHIGCGLSGVLADARRLVDRSRIECQKHWLSYDESMPVESCTQFTSTLVMQSSDTDDTMNRPASVALLFAGFDGDEPQLWHLDPSGTYTRYLGKAIGSNSAFAQKKLEEKYRFDMDVKDAIELCLITLEQAMEEQLRGTNIELMFMTKDNKNYNKLSEDELKKLLGNAD